MFVSAAGLASSLILAMAAGRNILYYHQATLKAPISCKESWKTAPMGCEHLVGPAFGY